MINLYKTNQGDEILINGENINLPDFLKLELVKENIDIKDYPYHPVVRFDFLLDGILGKRHRDNILEENHVICYNDLAAEYFLIRNKISKKSKQVRDYIVEKYLELLYDKPEDDSSN